MSRRSLQARAVAAAVVAIVLVLAVAGSAVYLLVARHLHASLDRSLRQRAAQVAQLTVSAPAMLTTPGALDAQAGTTQLSVEVVDRRGRIVARSLALGGRVLPIGGLVRSALARGATGYRNVSLGGDRERLYVAPLADLGGRAAGGAMIVAGSTHDLQETLASLRLFVVLAALGGALVVAGPVALLMRRALRPLGRLADSAAEIEHTGDPRRRLPTPAAADELARLGETLNAMLASLERARDAERRFLADASHELRTPLTALRGNVAYLRGHGETPELVDELEHDTERLAALADDLLVLSREEAAAAPRELVRLDALALEAAAAVPGVEVAAPGPVVVRGERAALERALANLVENAYRHGRGPIVVSVAEHDGLARVTVRDEGPGLQPYEARHAFERFWRGNRDAAGSGLGLAIVRATAERHGGRAYVEGAAFSVEVPAVRDFSESAGTTGAPPEKGFR